MWRRTPLELLPNQDIVGIDISEKQVAAARERLGVASSTSWREKTSLSTGSSIS
jgi:hypothetical protein